ncbi:MAG: hypothetical protein AAF533_10990 [Acidobacteriota bacterium]
MAKKRKKTKSASSPAPAPEGTVVTGLSEEVEPRPASEPDRASAGPKGIRGWLARFAGDPAEPWVTALLVDPVGRLTTRERLVAVLLLLPLLLGFAILKSYGLNPSFTDENIYFHGVALMHEGTWPYRDFFFAHPPGHLLAGYLFTLFTGGFSLLKLKVLSALAAGITGALVFWTARRAGGLVAAVTAGWLYLFNHDVLRASSHWTGVNMSVAWMAGGFLAVTCGRPILAGILLGIGTCTGVYILPAVLMLIVLLGLSDRRAALRLGIAAFAIILVVNVGHGLLYGNLYWDGVYRYHFRMPKGMGPNLDKAMPNILFHGFVLFYYPVYLGLMALPRAWHEIGQRTTPKLASLLSPLLRPGLAVALWLMPFWGGYVFFLSTRDRVFHFYFQLLFPAAAIAGGLYVASALRLLARGAIASDSKRRRDALIAGLVALLLVGWGWWRSTEQEKKLGYYERNVGKTQTYRSPESPLPASLDSMAKSWLFKPDRLVGERHSQVSYYLWHESRIFVEAEVIADYLRERARPGEALVGDSVSAPLVSLHSGVPLADHWLDTNMMRFKAELPGPEETVRRFEEARLRSGEGRLAWVLVRPGQGIDGDATIRAYFREKFREERTFTTRHYGRLLLMKRR